MTLNETLRHLVDNQMMSTIVLLIVIFVVRFTSNRFLQRHFDSNAEQRRRIASNIRNALFVLTVFGLLYIWAPSLRNFALSLTAFAVAIILATKELILCFSGTFLKTSTSEIKIGDWITVNGIRGEVVDQTFMSTRLQELGEGGSRYDFTGRTISLPNSIFLTAHVINDEMTKKFVYHTVTLAIDKDMDPAPIITAMTDAITHEMSADKETGLRFKSGIEEKVDISLPDAEPTVHFGTTGEGKVKLMIRAMMPTKHATAIEKVAMLAGLAAIRKIATEQSEKNSEDPAA
jgi:small-conductance mechanosensitive channel